jgi:hypothetical protein
MMRFKILLFVIIIVMITSIPVVYGYTDPVSLTLIWQFLASVAVGLLFFFKRIKFWIQNKLKSRKEK